MTYPLPEKVYFNVALDYLGLTNSGLDLFEAIRTLCLHIKADNALALYVSLDSQGFDANLEKDLVFTIPFTKGDLPATEPPPYTEFPGEKLIKSPYSLSRKDSNNLCQNKQKDVDVAIGIHHQAESNPEYAGPIYPAYLDYMCIDCKLDVCNSWNFLFEYFEVEEATYRAYDADSNTPLKLCVAYDKTYFKKDDLINFELSLKNNNDSGPATPYYLDEGNDFYSQQIDLAIQIHKAIHLDNYKSNLSNRHSRVQAWLDENFPDSEISQDLVKRMSKTISPDKIKKG